MLRELRRNGKRAKNGPKWGDGPLWDAQNGYNLQRAEKE